MAKNILRLACIAAPLLLASGHTLAASDTLKIGITQYPSTLHPIIDSMVAKSLVLSTAWRRTIIYGHDWKSYCNLCTEVPSFENNRVSRYTKPDGSEGLKVSVTLKDDLFWGDGTPVTTKDIILGHAIMTNPKVKGIPGLETNKHMEKIVALDDKKFDVYIDKITFKFNDYIPWVIPAHLEKEIYENSPENYDKRTNYAQNPTLPGLYHGPYLFDKVVQGSFINLTKNPHWKAKAPSFSKLIFKTIENTSALEAHLLSGSVDYIPGELGLTLDQALQFKKRHSNEFNVVHKPGLLYEHLDTNLDNPHLAKREVRQALMYGMDRQQITDKLFEGMQPVADSNVNSLDSTYFADTPVYNYNPEKAKALLKQAGYSNKNGVMVDKDGQPLTLELMTTAGNKTRELVQQVLQSQWKNIGVKAQINNQPARVYFGVTLNERKHKGLAMFAWASSPENVPFTVLHSKHIPHKDNGFSGQNYTGYSNPEMDELLVKIDSELDPSKRQLLFNKMQTLYAEDVPVLPLYFRADSFVIPKWLKGVRPTGHQFFSTNWVEEWTTQ